MPAPDGILARYLRELGWRRKLATVERALYAIRHAHLNSGCPNPTTGPATRAALRGLLRGVEEDGERALLVLSRGIAESVMAIEESVIGRRDCALVLANFFGGLARGELAFARREHLVFADGRAYLAVNRSERRQGSRIAVMDPEPNPGMCPVRALERWIANVGYDAGPLFARVTLGGHVVPEFLSDRTIARIISRRLEKIGLAYGRPVSPSGVRNGVVVEQLARGLSVDEAAARYGRVALRHVHRLHAIARVADLQQRAI